MNILTIYFLFITKNLVVRIANRNNVLSCNIRCRHTSRVFTHLYVFKIVPLKQITWGVIDLEGSCWRTEYRAVLVKVAWNNLRVRWWNLIHHIVMALPVDHIYRLIMRKDLRHRVDVYWWGMLSSIHSL